MSSRPGYIGHMFDHLRNVLYPAWGELEQALLSNGRSTSDGEEEVLFLDEEDTPSAKVYDDPESLRAFLEGMHAITYPAAEAFAARTPELETVEHVVDLDGASGAFLIALAHQFSGLKGTVMDLESVRPVAEDFFREHDLEDRLTFQAGDFFQDPLPAGDAYVLGFILHDWGEDAGSYLLQRIAEASEPGGCSSSEKAC